MNSLNRFDIVKNYIESFEYKLISTEYIDKKTKLKVKCNNGHIYETTFANFKYMKARCKTCANINQTHSIEDVKRFIEFKNYKLISNTYINSHTKIEIQCPNNHIFKMKYHHFKDDGRRCRLCSNKKTYTIEDVKNYIESFDYKLLSDFYKNTQTKLLLQCPKKHTYNVTFANFKNGTRCYECLKESKKIPYDEVKNYIESVNNYKLLSKEYIGSKEKLNIKCNNNHVFEMSFDNFKNRNQRCPLCHYEKINGNGNPNWNDNRDEVLFTEKLRRRFSKNWIIKNMKHDNNYHNWLKNPKNYHVDHIIPVAAFAKITLEKNLDENQMKLIVNDKNNLQLILIEENYKKSSRYDEEELNSYINKFYKNKYN